MFQFSRQKSLFGVNNQVDPRATMLSSETILKAKNLGYSSSAQTAAGIEAANAINKKKNSSRSNY